MKIKLLPNIESMDVKREVVANQLEEEEVKDTPSTALNRTNFSASRMPAIDKPQCLIILQQIIAVKRE